MPVELVEKGRAIAREKRKCPHCGAEISVKYDAKTKEVLFVWGGTNPKDGIIRCHECDAKLRWTPPEV